MANEAASLLLAVDSSQVKEGSRSLDELAKSGAGAEQATKGVTSASEILGRAVATVTAAYSSLRLGQYILEATTLNQRYSQMGLVMNVVAANTGKSRSEFDTTANTLQKLGISMLESRNTVIKLATANVDLANAEKLADLARNAAIVGNINTSEALDRLVLGVQTAQVEVLRGIGINVSFEQSYAKLAKQMGVNVNQLSESDKKQARLNAVMAEASNFVGLYEASLANAGKMLKSTERLSENLKIKIGAIFDDSAMLAVSAYSNQLLDLNNEADRLAANNSIKDWSRQIAVELAFVMDMGKNVFGIFGALGGLIAEQGKNIANLDFGAMTGTFARADEQLKAVLGDTSKYQDMVNARIIQEDLLSDKITGQNNNIRENTKNKGENTNVTNENTEAVKKAVKVKDELTLAELKMQESTKDTIDLDRQVKSLISSVATEQDKYNETLKELDRLKPYVPIETYNRALQKAQEELKGTSKVAKEMTTDTNDYAKMWSQSWTSIEQTGKQAFIQFAAHGTSAAKSIGEALKLSVLDMLYQITVRKWIINIGSSLESTFLNTVTSSGSGSLLNTASSGVKGLSGLLGGGSGMGGMGSMMSGMMSGIGAVAMPLMAALALDAASNAFAGDKTLGNGITDFIQKIPVLGAGWDIVAGLFGHGPMKFRQQSIQGTASASGFDGDISNVFRAKGGLFVGNKHTTQTEQFTSEQQAIFDAAIGGFYTSARDFVDNLGLSAELVDTFTKTVQIKSEKGKTVTEEAITDMIAGIGDSLAKNVLPNVEDFRKVGETTIQTLSRLSGEFSVLTGAASLLFDKSSQWAKDFVTQFGLGEGSAFLDKAGGANAFAGMVSGFAQNFLTDDQIMKPVIESLLSERDKLGLSGIDTRAQYTSAVQSGNLNQDQLIFLLQNQEAINQVFAYLDKVNASVSQTSITFGNATDKINETNTAMAAFGVARDANDTEYGQRLNTAIQEAAGSIQQLEGVASNLRSVVNAINPMSAANARSQVANGGLFAPNLDEALNSLGGMSSSGFENSVDFKRAKGANVAAINSLRRTADNELVAANSRLDALVRERDNFQQSLLRATEMMTIAINKTNRRFDKWDVNGMPPQRAA